MAINSRNRIQEPVEVDQVTLSDLNKRFDNLAYAFDDIVDITNAIAEMKQDLAEIKALIVESRQEPATSLEALKDEFIRKILGYK